VNETSLKRLKELDRELQVWNHVQAILHWDQETQMPDKAIDERAEQLTALSALIHEKSSSDELGSLLSDLGADDDKPSGSDELSALDRSLVRQVFRDYRQSTKLPAEFVRRLARATSLGQKIWSEARAKSDFSHFAPRLTELVELALERAEYLGYEDHPYDALLDQYEPFMKTAQVESVFAELEGGLVPLVEAIRSAPQVDDSFLLKDFPVDGQKSFGEEVLGYLGYEMDRGRLDVSTHPFTTGLGRDDVRITTRYNANYFKTSIFGTIHEAGHGLYELGVGEDVKGTSLGQGTSLGIHESQSRMWENMIGRSAPFWDFFYPKLVSRFPDQLAGVDERSFYRAVNKVEPSFIRVEADEVTYSLHIILRFHLETKLLTKQLGVNELPDAWREESKALLGIVPESDADGVLQDIHWSMGGIGYFPTYALGNLYAAQFYRSMEQEIPDLQEKLRAGDFSAPLNWLRTNIHKPGASLTAGELCRQVTKEDLNPNYFLDYLRAKYSDIYDLS
jgi:carboxypeptidase Taq